MSSSKMLKIRAEFLKLQLASLKKRYERQKQREVFIKKHLKEILLLKMDGWPRTKEMKDYLKWLDIVYKAKIEGVYSIGTSNCDVIANLNRFAKSLLNVKNK